MGVDIRFRVDWIRCDGYGLCGDLVPDLIDLDEWRYPIVLPGPIDPSRVHDAQRAVDCCPMKALALQAAVAERRPAGAGGATDAADPRTHRAAPLATSTP